MAIGLICYLRHELAKRALYKSVPQLSLIHHDLHAYQNLVLSTLQNQILAQGFAPSASYSAIFGSRTIEQSPELDWPSLRLEQDT